MTTTNDLEQQAADALTRAEEARAARATREAADTAERTRREQEWRATYVENFDPARLNSDITDARAALVEALRTDPLGKALVNVLALERITLSETSFAGNAAILVGREPGSIGAHDPRMPQQRNLTDAASLLVDIATQLAEAATLEHEQARQEAFTTATTDHGRLTAPAARVEPTYCATCQRLVTPDDDHPLPDGRHFHKDCPRPVRLHTAAQIAESNGAAAKAARWQMGYDN